EGVLRLVDAAAQSGVTVLEVGEEVHPLEYGQGESLGQRDPHFWTDPDRMILAVEAIAEQIEDHVPGIDVQLLHQNRDAYLSELEELSTEMDAEFAAIPAEKRALITNHHVFNYLAERFDFRVIGAVIPSGTTL